MEPNKSIARETRRPRSPFGWLAVWFCAAAALLSLPAAASNNDTFTVYDMSQDTTGRAPDKVTLRAELSNPIVLAGRGGKEYLRVGLTGSALEPADRAVPANICFVIDRSGSMSGRKIEDAKTAALMGIERLGEDDIVSIVAYDSTVSVPLPPTRAKNHSDIYRAISSIESGGNTALFAGVSKGAEQLRRFLDRDQVNRVILLSDGLANVGPSSSGELASLGRSLAREGITVSTIGLGLDYNEDLMVQLAMGGSGFHYFAQESSALADVFEAELGNARSVVAKEVVIRIRLGDGVLPVRVYGRDAIIRDGEVTVDLSQLYSGFENYLLLELDVSPTEAGAVRYVADVSASYRDLATQQQDTQSTTVAMRGTSSAVEASRSTNGSVLVALAEYVSARRYQEALDLRDSGRTSEAREVLHDNAAYLREQAGALDADQLLRLEQFNYEAADQLDEQFWNENRKQMKQRQYMLEQNNVY